MLNMMEKTMNPPKIIKLHGYAHYLVDIDRRNLGWASPCYMGHKGMALQKCVKIIDENPKK